MNTKAGAAKGAKTNKLKHGDDFFAKIGAKGGAKKVPKGFALMPLEKRRQAGQKGGRNGKRLR